MSAFILRALACLWSYGLETNVCLLSLQLAYAKRKDRRKCDANKWPKIIFPNFRLFNATERAVLAIKSCKNMQISVEYCFYATHRIKISAKIFAMVKRAGQKYLSPVFKNKKIADSRFKTVYVQ